MPHYRPLLAALAALAIGACAGPSSAGATAGRDTHATQQDDGDVASYEGADARGIPHYATIAISSDDSIVLRRAYGVEDPHRLYVSDSTEEGILKYDTQRKRCLTCYVNSYRIGYISVRRPGESWEEVERRVRGTPARVFTGGGLPASTSTSDLDPDVRPVVDAMLRDARAAGFNLRVTATYRSPLREAFLMAEGKARTHTLTSNHSYGRAIDIVAAGGGRHSASARANQIAFRRWVTSYRTTIGDSFRVLGKVDRTWDWAHVELPSATIGFRTIEEAITRGRACLAPRAIVPCNFPPHLPAYLTHSLVT